MNSRNKGKAGISFTVYGEPVAQPRARHFANQHTGRVVTVGHTKDHPVALWKERLIEAIVANRPEEPISGPVGLSVMFYRSIPASWSKKKQEQAKAWELLPTGRPDLDNLIKAVKDAATGIIWRDDSQVCICNTGKTYSTTPGAQVSVWEMRADDYLKGVQNEA